MFNKKQADNNYWMSYSDLLTGLVIIFLIISVHFWQKQKVSYKRTQELEAEFKMTKKQEKQLNIIDKAQSGLAKNKLFNYNTKYKRYEINVNTMFEAGAWNVPKENEAELKAAGYQLRNFIKNLNDTLKKDTLNIEFIVIIEGRAAKHKDKGSKIANEKANKLEWDYAKELSFKRAYNLQYFWNYFNIFKDMPYCDVLAVGSGFEGNGRYPYEEEEKNKTFIIQVIPKFKKIEK